MAPDRLRTFHHSAFPPERLALERDATVSVCLPARDEAETIGPIVQALLPLIGVGAIDQVVVLDDSTDGTGDIARALGAEVHDQASLCLDAGPVRGKGDALWRALEVARGDVIVYLDADSHRFGPHFACGLAGPLACEPGAAFAKAYYQRPWSADGVVLPEGGGRVTELCARPALAAFYPELAAFRQPLAGEMALRRDLAERTALPVRLRRRRRVAHRCLADRRHRRDGPGRPRRPPEPPPAAFGAGPDGRRGVRSDLHAPGARRAPAGRRHSGPCVRAGAPTRRAAPAHASLALRPRGRAGGGVLGPGAALSAGPGRSAEGLVGVLAGRAPTRRRLDLRHGHAHEAHEQDDRREHEHDADERRGDGRDDQAATRSPRRAGTAAGRAAPSGARARRRGRIARGTADRPCR